MPADTNNTPESNPLDFKAITKARLMASDTYVKAAIAQHAIADALLQRCQIMRKPPQKILEIGAADGYLSKKLLSTYPEAEVIAVDPCSELLQQSQNGLLEKHPKIIIADADTYPFAERGFDLIISNLFLHWLPNPQQSLKIWKSLLQDDGILLFTTLGPDTLCELKQCFSGLENYSHTHKFTDMHLIGDWLLAAGYTDPVMDVDIWKLTYDNLSRLFMDLKQTGSQCASLNRPQGLYGINKWRQMSNNYLALADKDGLLPATLEVIFAHAVNSKLQSNTNSSSEATFPIDLLRRR